MTVISGQTYAELAAAGQLSTRFDSSKSLITSSSGSTAINVQASAYGAKGNNSADDTAAIAAALAAAKAAKVPLYLPSGIYKITSTLDWSGSGVCVIGDGSALTQIRQYTNNIGIVVMGAGERCSIEGVMLRYNTKQTPANTAATALMLGTSGGSLTRSYFRDVGIQRCGYGIRYGESAGVLTTGAFSCQFDTLVVTGYAITALDFSCPNVNMTGNSFNNVYLNNDWEGDGNDSSAAQCVIVNSNDEIVFNQLNIEHAAFSATEALQISDSNCTINGLHCEVLDLNAEGKGMVYVTANAKVTINSLTNEGNNWSAGTTKPFFRVNYDGKLMVNGMSSGYSSFTVSVTNHPIITFGPNVTDPDVWLRGLSAGVFSEHTFPYVTGSVNGCKVWELNAPQFPVNAQTGTTYTLARTDSGQTVDSNNASAVTVTVPPESAVKLPIGTVIRLSQSGAGQVTVAAGAGVTINSRGAALKLAAQHAEAMLRKTASNVWRLSGDITP